MPEPYDERAIKDRWERYERLTDAEDDAGDPATFRQMYGLAAHACARDVPVLRHHIDRLAAEIAQMRAGHAVMEITLADLLSGAEAVDAGRVAAALGGRRTCVRCGAVLPAGAARCDPGCPPVVVVAGGAS